MKSKANCTVTQVSIHYDGLVNPLWEPECRQNTEKMERITFGPDKNCFNKLAFFGK